MIVYKRELQMWKGVPIYKVKENLEEVSEYGVIWVYGQLTYQFDVYGRHYECNTLEEAKKTITNLL